MAHMRSSKDDNDVITPSSTKASIESLAETIKREQDEMRIMVAAAMSPKEETPQEPKAPPGLDSDNEIVQVKKKKNRNQSAKRKLIQVLDAEESGEGSEPKVQSTENDNDKKLVDAGTQTRYTLPHTCRDVMWVPACQEPVIDVADEEDDTPEHVVSTESVVGVTAGIEVGHNVMDIDLVDDQSDHESDDDEKEPLSCNGAATRRPKTTGMITMRRTPMTVMTSSRSHCSVSGLRRWSIRIT